MTVEPVLRLDPEPRAAQQARAFLAAAAALGPDQVEVARLLVSELVTNSVVHAASAIEVAVRSGADGVVVAVTDADTGPLAARTTSARELDEGGRGFLLVAHLADAWGTEHSAGRKTVWFRLAAGADAAADQREPAPPPPAGATPARTAERRLRTLLLRPLLQRALSFEQQLGELVMRVMDAAGVAGVAVLNAAGQELVARGRVDGLPPLSWPLGLDDRRLGDLVVYTERSLDDEDEAFLALAAGRVGLLLSEHGLSHGERDRASGLDYLAEATELFASSLSVSLCLTLVGQIVVPRIGDWCALYAVDDHGRPRRVSTNHRNEERVDALEDALCEPEVVEAVSLAASGRAAQRLAAPLTVAGRRSVVTVAPLTSRGRTLGVVVVGRQEPLDALGFMALLELGRRAALAVDNARLHEEQVAAAQALQTSLLPTALPQVDGVELAARYHSASPGLSVGGDFYDAFLLPDGSLVVAVGDVCGKGAEAASVTGRTRDLLRLLLVDGHGLAPSLRRLNRALLDTGGARFCTVALARASRHDGGLRVQVCLAGHPEPVLLPANGPAAMVGVAGDLLGVMPGDIGLTEHTVGMAPGDALVLYTDGVTERRHGSRMFGQGGLRDALEAARGSDAELLAAEVERAARTFDDSDLRDDLAVLVLRHTAGESAAVSPDAPRG